MAEPTLDEFCLLELDERLLILTPTIVRQKITHHQRALAIWEALLPVVGQGAAAAVLTEAPPPAVAHDRPRLSLDEKQTRVQQSLQRLGKASVTQLAATTGLSVPQVYSALKNLPGVENYQGNWWLEGESVGCDGLQAPAIPLEPRKHG